MSAVQSANGNYVPAYLAEAFPGSVNNHRGPRQGGIYGGDGGLFAAPDDGAMAARARLRLVMPGKVFVRWAASSTLASPKKEQTSGRETAGWERAAMGAWWMTDNLVERVVEETARMFDRCRNSAEVARRFGNVWYTKEDGTFWSDMGAVVVCRTTKPIHVIIGVGRPVANPMLKDKPLDTTELQVVIPTCDKPKGEFKGRDFLEPLFFGSSTAFTDWWINSPIVELRRKLQVATARSARKG